MKLSQTARILKEIKNYPKFHLGHGVPNHKLSRTALNYTARISNLREDGYGIVAEREIRNGKATGTYRYRLVSEPK